LSIARQTVRDYPKFYRQAEAKLRREQRKLSKGGKNREKQRRKVTKLHEKVANQRKDFLHQLSRQIANAYDVVAIEDLNMKSTNDNGFGMLKTFGIQTNGKRQISGH